MSLQVETSKRVFFNFQHPQLISDKGLIVMDDKRCRVIDNVSGQLPKLSERKNHNAPVWWSCCHRSERYPKPLIGEMERRRHVHLSLSPQLIFLGSKHHKNLVQKLSPTSSHRRRSNTPRPTLRQHRRIDVLQILPDRRSGNIIAATSSYC